MSDFNLKKWSIIILNYSCIINIALDPVFSYDFTCRLKCFCYFIIFSKNWIQNNNIKLPPQKCKIYLNVVKTTIPEMKKKLLYIKLKIIDETIAWYYIIECYLFNL